MTYNPFYKSTRKLDACVSEKIQNKWAISAIGLTAGFVVIYKVYGKDWLKYLWKKRVIDYEHKLKEEERHNQYLRDVKLEKVKTEEIHKRKMSSHSEESDINTQGMDEVDVEPSRIITLDDLKDEETSVKPLAGLLIPEKIGGVMIYGPKGSLKSHLVLQLLCQLNTGEAIKILPDFDPYYGKPSQSKPYCFYIDAENGISEVKKRIRKYADRMDNERFKFVFTNSFGKNGLVSALKTIEMQVEELPQNSVVVCAFDNLNSLLDNANNPKEAKELLNGIKRIHKKTLGKESIFIAIIVHHENNEGNKYGSTILSDLTPNIIHIKNTKDFDIKELIYENHRFCSFYNRTKIINLKVLHSGPPEDEDIEIIYHEQNDDEENDMKLQNQKVDEKKKEWNTPEIKANIKLLLEENNLVIGSKGCSSRKVSDLYKQKYGDGPSHSTMDKLLKEIEKENTSDK